MHACYTALPSISHARDPGLPTALKNLVSLQYLNPIIDMVSMPSARNLDGHPLEPLWDLSKIISTSHNLGLYDHHAWMRIFRIWSHFTREKHSTPTQPAYFGVSSMMIGYQLYLTPSTRIEPRQLCGTQPRRMTQMPRCSM